MKNKNYLALLTIFTLVFSIGSFANFSRADDEQEKTSVSAGDESEKSSENIKDVEDKISAGEKLKKEKDDIRKELEQKRNKIKETIKENQNKIQKEREDLRNEIKEKKDNLKIEIEKKRGNQIEQIKERTIRKITSAIARLENMQARLETRITKLEIKNINTTSAKASLAISKQKIVDAKLAIESIKDLVSTPEMKTSDKVKLVKEAGKKVEELLKESHKALVEAINNLKENKDAIKLDEKEKINTEIKTQASNNQ